MYIKRRKFLKQMLTGSVVSILGQPYVFSGNQYSLQYKNQILPDGRLRLPKQQKVIRRLRPMGGERGLLNAQNFKLKVSGEVNKPLEINFDQLINLPQNQLVCDIHCVSGWSVMESQWQGVLLKTIAEMASIKRSARFVIFESEHGFTSNISIQQALQSNVMIVHQHQGKRLLKRNGGPIRSLVPDLYFWKSAKWLKGIRFSKIDEPGYWEKRGYDNGADPWNDYYEI
jgi:DMSO/TMAO reductase YedYZ molybdopterin-dependent catalytic subunit